MIDNSAIQTWNFDVTIKAVAQKVMRFLRLLFYTKIMFVFWKWTRVVLLIFVYLLSVVNILLLYVVLFASHLSFKLYASGIF